MRARVAGVVMLCAGLLGSCEEGVLSKGGDGALDAPRVSDGPRPADQGKTADGPAADQGKTADGPAADQATATDQAAGIDQAVTPDQAAVVDQAVAVDQAVTADQAVTGGPTIAGCPVFPPSNPWNIDISADPVDPSSATIIAAINASGGQYLHPDFSSTQGWNPPYGAGIPYVVVPGTQPKVCVSFTYSGESDPGPYPIPSNAPIEGGPSSGGDRHILVIDKDSCKLYETYASYWSSSSSCWDCGSGAIFDLSSNALRTDCWTSADAAGLPIFPGLVRYDEAVTAGVIEHALRVTFSKTRQAYLHPATHFASSNTSASLPPMGLRLRLKASYDISSFTGAAKVVLVALKKYGMIVADNGSNWYISGAPHASWNDGNLNTLKQVPGTAFEVVKPTGKLYTVADCP